MDQESPRTSRKIGRAARCSRLARERHAPRSHCLRGRRRRVLRAPFAPWRHDRHRRPAVPRCRARAWMPVPVRMRRCARCRRPRRPCGCRRKPGLAGGSGLGRRQTLLGARSAVGRQHRISRRATRIVEGRVRERQRRPEQCSANASPVARATAASPRGGPRRRFARAESQTRPRRRSGERSGASSAVNRRAD